MSSFISQNFTEIEAVTGCTFAGICHTVFRMFSCLHINWQPFYLSQLLKFQPFDWLIEIYLQTEGQGTHHKMVSLQPMAGFSLLFGQSRIILSAGEQRDSKNPKQQPKIAGLGKTHCLERSRIYDGPGLVPLAINKER